MKTQFPSSEEVEHLNLLFGFEATGLEQDWFVEFSDSTRISEFLDVYETADLTLPQKIEVMNLIIASYDELSGDDSKELENWDSIASAIKRDAVLFRDTLEYWSCPNSKEDDEMFEVTKRLRMIKDAL